MWQERQKSPQNKEIEKKRKKDSKNPAKTGNKNKNRKRFFLLKKDFLVNWTSAKKGERLNSVHQVVCFTSSYREIIDNDSNNNNNSNKTFVIRKKLCCSGYFSREEKKERDGRKSDEIGDFANE